MGCGLLNIYGMCFIKMKMARVSFYNLLVFIALLGVVITELTSAACGLE